MSRRPLENVAFRVRVSPPSLANCVTLGALLSKSQFRNLGNEQNSNLGGLLSIAKLIFLI